MRTFTLAAAALATALVAAAPEPAKASAEPFIGEIMIVPYNFCPRGFLPADGRLLAISQNTALFSLIGTLYGGNGATTFALPAPLPIQTVRGDTLKHCIATEGIFPSRD